MENNIQQIAPNYSTSKYKDPKDVLLKMEETEIYFTLISKLKLTHLMDLALMDSSSYTFFYSCAEVLKNKNVSLEKDELRFLVKYLLFWYEYAVGFYPDASISVFLN